MEPIPAPEAAKTGRPDCQLINMGPPRGVSDDDCATAQMLISPISNDLPGYPARRQYAYYRPTPAELEHLAAGGFIEFCQYGQVVQPFSAAVWPAPAIAEELRENLPGEVAQARADLEREAETQRRGVTDDRNDPGLSKIDPGTGMQQTYLVLSDDERAKGYVRPLRRSYRHLTCGTVTTMGQAIAETYARDPRFYSGTYCTGCRDHFPVGEHGEFVWDGTDEKVGS